jgi:non-ribosomal peptide synthetase component F
VAIRHDSLLNLCAGMDEVVGCAPGDVFCAISSVSFDIAAVELLWPLTAGATVLVADVSAGAPDGTSPATHLQATPTVLRLLLDDPGWRPLLAGLRLLLLGGEPVPADLVDRVHGEFDCWVYNMYGPTETTIWSACRPVDRAADAGLIGAPLPNTTLHVLDQDGVPVPDGDRVSCTSADTVSRRAIWAGRTSRPSDS